MNDLKIASRWQRLGAFAIDAVFIWIISIVLLSLIISIAGPIDDETNKLLEKSFGKLVGLFFYFPFFTLIWRATPGKKFLKIKVVERNGAKLPWYRIIFREMFLRWISAIVLGHFWIFFNKKNKTAWDFGSGSIVVKV